MISIHCHGPRARAGTIARNDLPWDKLKRLRRPHRRTQFTWDDWVKHRSTIRYLRHIQTIPQSAIFKGLLRPTVFLLGVTLAVNAYLQAYAAGILPPWAPWLACKMEAFTVTAPALSLLLALRTNTSYRRWLEARRTWGLIIVNSRDLLRQGTHGGLSIPWESRSAWALRITPAPASTCPGGRKAADWPLLLTHPLLCSLPQHIATCRTRCCCGRLPGGWSPSPGL